MAHKMTTFTTEDRILAEKDGSFTVNVEPIPFAGLVTLTEPEIKHEPVAWINRDEKEGWLNWDKNTALPINIPLFAHPATELTNIEIADICTQFLAPKGCNIYTFARAILKKASEK